MSPVGSTLHGAPRSPSGDPGGPRLATHIRGWMLVGGGVPLLALFFFGYLAVQRALIEASDDHLVSVVEARRFQIETWLDERITDLEVIGGSKDCIELVEQAVSHQNHAHVCRYLESFQTGSRDYRAIELYDVGWNLVAANTHALPSQDMIGDERMRQLLEETPGSVKATLHLTADFPAELRLGNRLSPPDSSLVGYVVAALDLNGTFAPILGDRAGLGRTGEVYLADLAASGRVLLPEDPQGGVESVDKEILERVSRQAVGTVHYRERSGKNLFAGFTTIEDRGWLVVARMDESEALELLFSLRRGFVVAGLLTVIAVILFSARVSHRLSAPLAELAAAARRIKEGRHHERVPELEGREVAEVGKAFNEMLDALEETRKQQVQASTLAAVGELSSGVAHEIRNRLSSVKMNLQALERKVCADETYAELGQIAFEQVIRIERLLNDLLNYARPVGLSLESVPIMTLLDAAVDPLRAEADAKGVRLAVQDRTGGAAIRADRERLEEALSNLVRNAIEAVSSEGHVTVRGLPADGNDGVYLLEVEDDGPGLRGIPAEDLFRPFFTTKEGGTGLGLAYARKIVELHGGRIGAKPSAGGGAVLFLEIPEKAVGSK